ncbi:hypothetical protein BJY04DRAFT_192672 [Aspergillus karnatakaensis]|uniref:uncharacterized protein n=1 Tax=Aspergillus karnatakaensis TaxID=1810916 RepID=UPI003CCCCD1C
MTLFTLYLANITGVTWGAVCYLSFRPRTYILRSRYMEVDKIRMMITDRLIFASRSG